MGNNLLSALKNAGLTDAKKARKAENAKKQQKHRELKRGEDKAETQTEEIRCETQNVQKIQAIKDLEEQNKERLARAYKNAALTDVSGRRKFYFETLDRFIDCMMLSDVANALLDRGKYAIVANEKMDDYILVRRSTALTIEAIDKKRVIMMRRQES